MKLHKPICAMVVLIGAPVWAQMQDSTPQPPVPGAVTDDATAGTTDETASQNAPGLMVTPPPVSAQAYPIELSSQERSNYLRGGLAFTGAYSDNVLGSLHGTPLSDLSFSVAPSVALDETTSRSHLTLNYAPGFTFYRRFTSYNEADQNAAVNFAYRLSPHVTFSANDAFQKSSSLFNQPDFGSAGEVGGGAEGPNFSVIAPIADRLSDTGSAGISYQFALNQMMGASGTFSYLHYPNPAQVPGLYDSNSQAGEAFYAHRISNAHYVGVTYQYQRLIANPAQGASETQTHGALVFYTVYPAKGLSLSMFGGEQYSDTVQPFLTSPFKQWAPAGGASLGWRAHLTSIAISYIHAITGGGGLIGAVEADSANCSVRQEITRNLSASVAGGYAQNDVLGGSALGESNGHSISGTASLQQRLGTHVGVLLGYTRLRQDYSGVVVLASTPNTNREFVSVTYQFARPIGR